MSTGFVWLEQYAWHDTGRYAGFVQPGGPVQPHEHFEHADTKARLASLIEVSGLGAHLDRLPVEPATREDVLRVHDAEYIDRLELDSGRPRGGEVENGSPFGNGGYDIALKSAGGTIAAVKAVLNGRVRNAYGLVRPPGHHALPGSGMGFCMLANIGIAVGAARERFGPLRIAVVDWDAHHGNGTQAIFWDDPTTLTISLHQDQIYPVGSGFRDELGGGPGFGANLNMPLPAGCGDGAYIAAMNTVVVPALRRFLPDLILVACGFDASIHDPLGRMMVTAFGYRAMARAMIDVADELCDGRLVMSHEGGYSAVYVPICGLAVIEELAGIDTGVGDPFVSDELRAIPDQALQPHQASAIASAGENVQRVPRPNRTN